MENYTLKFTDYHGGKREGAGRRGFGVTKKVSITLPPDDWEYIDRMIKSSDEINSRSAFFRHVYADRFNFK